MAKTSHFLYCISFSYWWKIAEYSKKCQMKENSQECNKFNESFSFFFCCIIIVNLIFTSIQLLLWFFKVPCPWLSGKSSFQYRRFQNCLDSNWADGGWNIWIDGILWFHDWKSYLDWRACLDRWVLIKKRQITQTKLNR